MRANNIAKTLGAYRRTVIWAIKPYKELGHEGDLPRSGRPRTANTPENRMKLKSIIQ
jgi:transposase